VALAIENEAVPVATVDVICSEKLFAPVKVFALSRAGNVCLSGVATKAAARSKARVVTSFLTG